MRLEREGVKLTSPRLWLRKVRSAGRPQVVATKPQPFAYVGLMSSLYSSNSWSISYECQGKDRCGAKIYIKSIQPRSLSRKSSPAKSEETDRNVGDIDFVRSPSLATLPIHNVAQCFTVWSLGPMASFYYRKLGELSLLILQPTLPQQR